MRTNKGQSNVKKKNSLWIICVEKNSMKLQCNYAILSISLVCIS